MVKMYMPPSFLLRRIKQALTTTHTLQKHEQFTRHQAKRPTISLVNLKNRCGHRCDRDQYICQRHIDDLKIRDSSHFFVFVYDANYQDIAKESDEDHESVR
jgi:hypothetical protein